MRFLPAAGAARLRFCAPSAEGAQKTGAPCGGAGNARPLSGGGRRSRAGRYSAPITG